MDDEQLSDYALELLNTHRNYAANFEPTPAPPYPIVHKLFPKIQVPIGCLPIKIVQFASLDSQSTLLHWALFIATSSTRGIGNFYEVVGSPETGYFTQLIMDDRHPQWDRDRRGSHLVGWVPPWFLSTFDAILITVPVHQGWGEWNGQMWVVNVLKAFKNQPHLFVTQMEYPQWYEQMRIAEKEWEDSNNA